MRERSEKPESANPRGITIAEIAINARTRANFIYSSELTGVEQTSGNAARVYPDRQSREISKSILLPLMSRDADRLLAYGEIPARCVAKVDCRVAHVRSLNTFLDAINRSTTNRAASPSGGLPIGSKVNNAHPHLPEVGLATPFLTSRYRRRAQSPLLRDIRALLRYYVKRDIHL